MNEDQLRLELVQLSGKFVDFQQPLPFDDGFQTAYYIGMPNINWMFNATSSDSFKNMVFLLPEESGMVGKLRPRLDSFVLTFNSTFLKQSIYTKAHLVEHYSVRGGKLLSRYLGLWKSANGVRANDVILWRRRRNLGGITFKVRCVLKCQGSA